MRTTADSPPLITRDATAIHWGSAFAGALCASALALVLHGFAGAIGLAASSTAPTWRDASIGLWVLSGVYLVLVALASYGLGGYVAGWLRSWSTLDTDDRDTREGLHGLLMWAIATLLSSVLLAFAVAASARGAATATTSSTISPASENLIAYDLDRLLRSDGRNVPQTDHMRVRAEAGRILLTAGGRSGVTTDDRQYLTRLVAAQTNLAAPEAERRVAVVIASASDNISRARRSAVILAFMAASAALVGAAAAWFAAGSGARHGRDPVQVSIWGKPAGTRPLV